MAEEQPGILCVETDFLMSFAEARDEATNKLAQSRPAGVRLAIPSICFMEAFSTLQARRQIQRKFDDDFKGQRRSFEEGMLWVDRGSRLRKLADAAAEIEVLFDQFVKRLYLTIEVLMTEAEIIPLSKDDLGTAFRQVLKDPTDNLVLACICGHARSATCT